MSESTEPLKLAGSIDPSQPVRDQRIVKAIKDHKLFGAIIVTQPYLDPARFDEFRVYTINPIVVKKWIGPHPNIARIVNCVVEDYRLPAEDVKTISNVNELKIRMDPDKLPYPERGLSELWWKEKESGNDFSWTADLWASTP